MIDLPGVVQLIVNTKENDYVHREAKANTATLTKLEENAVFHSYNTFQKGFSAGYSYCVYESIVFAPRVPLAFPGPLAPPPGLSDED